jgi:hypothetical protein
MANKVGRDPGTVVVSVRLGDFVGEIDRILGGDKLGRPHNYRDARGRHKVDSGAEWDWWRDLDVNDRSYIQRHCMADGGVRPDVVAHRHGTSVDDIMTQLVAAVREARRRSPRSDDPLEWEWDDLEQEESERIDLPTLDLVGPGEVAQRFGVQRSTISQWRGRYDDFPAPLAYLDDGRAGVCGRKGAGLPVWEWSSVRTWGEITGRLK